jgi:hypothetical protein
MSQEFDYEQFQDDEYEAAYGRPLFSQAIPRDMTFEPIPDTPCPVCGEMLYWRTKGSHILACKFKAERRAI